VANVTLMRHISDEAGCYLFELDSNNYRKQYPSVEQGKATPVIVNINISSIGSFEGAGKKDIILTKLFKLQLIVYRKTQL
jgi:hypothetical protein